MSNYTRATEIVNNRCIRAKEQALNNQTIIYEQIPAIKALQDGIIKDNARLLRSILLKRADVKDIVNTIKNQTISAKQKIAELLVQNGYESDFLDTKYTCKICDDTGFKDGYRCICLLNISKQLDAEELLKNSSIPKETFDDFSCLMYPKTPFEEQNFTIYDYMVDILKSCINYAKNFSNSSPSLFMIGDTGLGKTHLSSAIGTEVSIKGFNVIYESAPDLFRYLNDEYFNKNTENNLITIKRVLSCDLLIIDDLGAEFENQFSNSTLYNIINTRANNKKSTIINTNLTIEQLKRRYESRIISRLMTMYTVIKFYGSDIRQLKLMNKE